MSSQTDLLFPSRRIEVDPTELCSDEERSVFGALPEGARNARQIKELAEATDLNGRRVQEIVKHLREEHGVPIGTSMSRPYGNYLIVDPEELRKTVNLLRTRGISNLVQAAKLKGLTAAAYLQEVQTELLDEEAA